MRTGTFNPNYKHGKRHTPEWKAWQQMHQRCNNPNNPAYKNYGGRGIKVCERWNWFHKFYEDMGDRPGPEYSLDRIDNNGDYTPENCRWSTRKEQNNNRRMCRQFTINGITRNLKEWAAEHGLPYDRVKWRVAHGWPIERALIPGDGRKGGAA